MTGYVAIQRGLLGHSFFKDEPFTEREAWIWMIAEAAWEPRRRRVGRTVFDLKRGQFVHARRFMAEAWKWHESRVRRFIDRLESESMIGRLATGEATIITICKYDDYQSQRPARDQQTDQPATSPRPKQEELKPLKKDDGDGARAEPLVTPNAMELAGEIATIVGLPDPMEWPAGWCGAPMRVAEWLDQGWRRDIILACVRGTMARKRDGPPSTITYFEKPIAKAHAQQSAPLPRVEIVQGETIHVVQGSGQQNQRGSLTDAAQRLAAEFAQNRPGSGGEAGGNIVRLLPEGGRERS